MILALVSGRTSKIVNPDINVETNAMMSALKKFGLNGSFSTEKHDAIVLSSSFDAFRSSNSHLVIDAKSSALVARVCSWLATLGGHCTSIQGTKNLISRPVLPLITSLKESGAKIEFTDNFCQIPFKVFKNIDIPETIHVDAQISSQFVSGPIFAALALSKQTTIVSQNLSRSLSYIRQTIDVARKYGAKIEHNDGLTEISILNGVTGLDKFSVPTDFTALSYYLAALLGRGGKLTVNDYFDRTLQGEKLITEIFQKFGGQIDVNGNIATFVLDKTVSKKIEIDLSDAPNITPTVAVMAALRHGVTHIRGAGITSYHKSARVLAIAEELSKCGVELEVENNKNGEADELIIKGNPNKLKSAELSDHGDHRILMSLFVLSLFLPDGSMLDCSDSPSTSLPCFLENMKLAGWRE